jgi:hypothetical protein
MRMTAAAAALGVLLAGCAETNAPLPEPVEVLLVVNRISATLSVIPVDQPAAAVKIALGAPAGTPTGVSVRDSIALVPLGSSDAVVVVDLRVRAVIRTITLPPGSGAIGSAIVDDSVAYVANPGRNSVTRLDLWTGDTAELAVGTTPQGVVFVRGRVFVLNGNVPDGAAVAPPSPSWISVVDPATNALASGVDSIPLTGPGNARFADIGSDGLLYVVSAGTGAASDGRLSIVDPVARAEIASFAGFGAEPGNPASDGDERVFVSSRAEGVMAFDARTRVVTRGAGSGVAVPNNSAVAVDSRGRVYAVDAGGCTPGSTGVAHVLDSQLLEIRTIPLGECPVAAAIAKVP